MLSNILECIQRPFIRSFLFDSEHHAEATSLFSVSPFPRTPWIILPLSYPLFILVCCIGVLFKSVLLELALSDSVWDCLRRPFWLLLSWPQPARLGTAPSTHSTIPKTSLLCQDSLKRPCIYNMTSPRLKAWSLRHFWPNLPRSDILAVIGFCYASWQSKWTKIGRTITPSSPGWFVM